MHGWAVVANVEYKVRYIMGHPAREQETYGLLLLDEAGLSLVRRGAALFTVPFTSMTGALTSSSVKLFGKSLWNSVATPWGPVTLDESESYLVVRCLVAGATASFGSRCGGTGTVSLPLETWRVGADSISECDLRSAGGEDPWVWMEGVALRCVEAGTRRCRHGR